VTSKASDALLTRSISNIIAARAVVVPRDGSVRLRSHFFDFTGRFVFHCRMMDHEELGTMQVVEVYKA
jgi:FtsP/CotA-like multicopper oxidase with cupredoxin domain